MKTIDAMRTHISNLRYQGLKQVAMVDVEKCLNEIERELEEEYVALPKDADGETIHIGDRVENNERVVCITLTDGSWEPSVRVEDGTCLLEEYFCNEVSHYHEPTVEDVLFEFARFWSDEELTDIEHLQPHAAQTIAEFAAKLQLREEDE